MFVSKIKKNLKKYILIHYKNILLKSIMHHHLHFKFVSMFLRIFEFVLPKIIFLMLFDILI